MYAQDQLTAEELQERDKALGADNPIITKTGFYKTRDGYRAFIRHISRVDIDAYPCKGHVEHGTKQQHITWAKSGKVSATGEKPNDIIGPWQ